MRTFRTVLVCSLCLSAVLSAQEPEPAPLTVVKKRMSALNKHDLQSFLATYAEDVSVYVYPDRVLGKGKSHITKIFSPMIDQGKVHVDIVNTMTADSYAVVETRTSFGTTAEAGVAIYEVRDGLIQSVRFVRDGIRAKRIKKKKERRRRKEPLTERELDRLFGQPPIPSRDDGTILIPVLPPFLDDN